MPDDFAILFADVLSPEAQGKSLAELSREVLSDAQAQNVSVLGYAPAFLTLVNGAVVALNALDRLRDGDTVTFEFDALDDVVRWVAEQLAAHAPYKTGQFRESIKCYADGAEIDPDAELKTAAEYVFLSTVAYVRKIEGADGRDPESPQAPDGVFEAVAALAAQRFGNQAKIRFTYVAADEGGISQWAQTPSARSLAHARGGRPEHHTEWLTRVPAITVSRF